MGAAPVAVAAGPVVAAAPVAAIVQEAAPQTITEAVTRMDAVYESMLGEKMYALRVMEIFHGAQLSLKCRIAEKHHVSLDALEHFFKAYENFAEIEPLPNAGINAYSDMLAHQLSLEAAWKNPNLQAAVREYCATAKAEYAALEASPYAKILDTDRYVRQLARGQVLLNFEVPPALVENPDHVTERIAQFKTEFQQAVDASRKSASYWHKRDLLKALDGSRDIELKSYGLGIGNQGISSEETLASSLPIDMRLIRKQALAELVVRHNFNICGAYNAIISPRSDFDITCPNLSVHSLRIEPFGYEHRYPEDWSVQEAPAQKQALKQYNFYARASARRYLIAHPFDSNQLDEGLYEKLLATKPEYVAGKHISPSARKKMLAGIDACLEAIDTASSMPNLLARYTRLVTKTSADSIALLEQFLDTTAPEGVTVDKETHTLAIGDDTLREEVANEAHVLEAEEVSARLHGHASRTGGMERKA